MPKPHHRRPGQDETRAYGQTRRERFEIGLDDASAEELAGLLIGEPESACTLIEHRPFRTWEDVERIRGFELGMVDDLRSGGAHIGGKRI